METSEKTEAIHLIHDKIKDIRIAMLTTEESDGTLRSRPMATNEMEEDGVLWFFTGEFTPKVAEVVENHKVNVSYSDPDDNLYVSISGEATVVTDKNKIHELWDPYLKAWFPKGKDDPNIALLKVVPSKAEYWDSESSNMVLAFNVVKSIFKGEKHESGEHKKFDL